MRRVFGVLAFPALVAAQDSTASSRALARLLDDVQQHTLETSLTAQIAKGEPVTKLPDLSFGEWRRETGYWQGIGRRAAAIGERDLNTEERLSRRVVAWQANLYAQRTPFYWMDFSGVTPYSSPLRTVTQALAAHPIATAKDRQQYLALLRQVAPFIDSIRAGLRARAARGNLLARDAIPGSASLVKSYAAQADASPFGVSPARLATLDADSRSGFQHESTQEISTRINPALTSLASYLEGEYAKRAPNRVGVSQYHGGREYARWLVRFHTTLDLTPEQVHRIGLREVAKINSEMASIRRELGFTGSKQEFHAQLRKDPRFFAKVPEEFGDRLMVYAKRIEPKLGDYFGRLPRARGDVRRLDPKLEATMTFGYYQEPTPSDAVGHYFYNGSSLPERSLLFGGALIAHELWPGHHFQINLAKENPALPEWRRDAYFTAFGEGWGDYAATVAGEMGMYADPYDRYGRLSMSMFIACRLVVDTGMNFFGWSRERAMQFMRDNALESETQIRSETLRYSTDLPGQALAYKTGSLEFERLRQRAQQALGARFDIRHFHDQLLASGMLPMSVLADKMEWWLQTSR